MNSFLTDLRHGWRVLRSKPTFSIVAVLTLALGIGADTVLFGAMNTLLLKSLPYVDPDRIVLIWGKDAESSRGQVSFTDMADLRGKSSSFEGIACFTGWAPLLSGTAEAERVPGLQVGEDYFSVMKGKPLLGRLFLAEDQQDGKDFVVVLSHGLWQRKFNADPNVVGRTIQLNSRTYTVVGVLGPEFESLPQTLVPSKTQLYRPVAERFDETQRSARHLRAVARLKPDVSPRQALAEVAAIGARFEREYPETNTGYGLNVVQLHEDTVGPVRPVMLLLFGAVGLVLLIACVNVANLLLVRTAARQREIAVRSALGAGMGRIVRQLLTESLVLSGMGGALGFALAYWGVQGVASFGAKLHPMLASVTLDGRVLAFTAGLSILTGLAFGLLPALHAARPDLNQAFKDGGPVGDGPGRGRLRGMLIGAETALACVLLVGAGLLVKSVWNLRSVDPGFDARNVLTLNLSLPAGKYPKPADRAAFFMQVNERVSKLPGVKAAGFGTPLPFSGSFDGRGVRVETKPVPPGAEPSPEMYVVTPDYPSAMNIPLIAGRTLTKFDSETSELVVMVNESAARAFWPGESAVGKRIKFISNNTYEDSPWRTVVGIVGDVRHYGLDQVPRLQFYVPTFQFPASNMALAVRTHGDPRAMTDAVRREILSVDRDQAPFNVRVLEQLVADSTALRSLTMWVLGGFALFALMLASLGIYGVVAYTVVRRRREIGIRMAVGADRRDVVSLMLKQGMTPALAGLGLGLGISFAATRLMASLLFNTAPTDAPTFLGIALLLAGVTLAACWIPARRAAATDPMAALRAE